MSKKAVLSLILLLLGLFLGLYFLNQKTHLFSKASTSAFPQQIKISNLSDNSMTISWLTNQPSTGFVEFGTSESLGQTASDDRDPASPKLRLTHHISLKNLTPNTVYFFKINSGSDTYDNGGKPYQQVSAPAVSTPPPLPQPFFGAINKAGGGVPEEALVYLQFTNGSLLSSYIRQDGNWLITLNNARSLDLKSYLSPQDENTVNLTVQAGKDGAAQVEAKLKQKEVFSSVTLVPSLDSTKEASSSGGLNKLVNKLNQAGAVLFDLGILRSNFGKKGEGLEGDLNGDGIINSLDYATAIKQNPANN